MRSGFSLQDFRKKKKEGRKKDKFGVEPESPYLLCIKPTSLLCLFVCLWGNTHVEKRGQPAEIDSLYHVSPWNQTSHKAWWQMPLPAEPSHWPEQEIFNSFSLLYILCL